MVHSIQHPQGKSSWDFLPHNWSYVWRCNLEFLMYRVTIMISLSITFSQLKSVDINSQSSTVDWVVCNSCWISQMIDVFIWKCQPIQIIIVRRAGLLLSQQDFEWRWSVPLFQCLTVLEFSFILFDLCLLITFFNFIMNYVPIVTFWIFTYHKIWILSIMFCFIWSYWIIYFLACL